MRAKRLKPVPVRTVLHQILAYAEKDIHQLLRFKAYYLSSWFLPGLVNFGLFATVFFGFVRGGTAATTGVNEQNFVAFTLLGALSSTIFNLAYGSFITRFSSEKVWETTPALLASPLSPWSILFGGAISDMLGISVVIVVFLSAAYILYPVSVFVLLSTIAYLLMIYFMTAGLSLIRGVAFLINENLDPIFGYSVLGAAYLSCFYYPASFVPSFLQPLAMINPIYFAVYSMRTLWFNLPFEFSYPIIALGATILSLTVGIVCFQWIWRNMDITGY